MSWACWLVLFLWFIKYQTGSNFILSFVFVRDEGGGVSVVQSCLNMYFLPPTLRWKWWCACVQCLSQMQLSPLLFSKWIPGRSKSPSWIPQPIRHQPLPPRKGGQPIRSLQRCSPLMLRSLLMHHRWEKIVILENEGLVISIQNV